MEYVLAFDLGNEIGLDDIGLIKFQGIQMVLLHVNVILWLFELIKSLYDVRENLYLFLLGQLWIEVIGLEWFFEERKHDQI